MYVSLFPLLRLSYRLLGFKRPCWAARCGGDDGKSTNDFVSSACWPDRGTRIGGKTMQSALVGRGDTRCHGSFSAVEVSRTIRYPSRGHQPLTLNGWAKYEPKHSTATNVSEVVRDKVSGWSSLASALSCWSSGGPNGSVYDTPGTRRLEAIQAGLVIPFSAGADMTIAST